MSDASQFDFTDLKPLEMPVTLPGGKRYVLREASEAAFRDFRSAQSRGASLSEDRTMSMGVGIGDADSALLKGCLFEVKDDGGHGGVSIGFILALPRRVTSALVKQVLQWMIDSEEKDKDGEDKDGPKEQPNSTYPTLT